MFFRFLTEKCSLRHKHFSRTARVFVLAIVFLNASCNGHSAKNVVLMITDGAGFNAFYATSYYQHGCLGKQPYDQPSFVTFGCTTYSLNKDGIPQGYDPERAWSDPEFILAGYTDSAAAATALNTGVKTTNGRICLDRFGNDLTTFAQLADRLGKSTGAVTTVPLSHATPAGVWSHNNSRGHYAAIANEMIFGSGLDVIMGAGHPKFDNDGRPVSASFCYDHVGGESTWNDLKNGKTGKGWTLIDSKADFEAIANGTQPVPDRLIGVPQVYQTTQQKRAGKEMSPTCPLNDNVPDLATMSRAAIQVLKKNQKGFYLMIEGGAVDWANHSNNIERMIEEQVDFNNAVEAVVHWIETESSWDETLLIVTSDHECGMIWGSDTYADSNNDCHYQKGKDSFNRFNAVVNKGQGKVPRVQYGHGSHTNALVPLYARGPGSEQFADLADGTDSKAGRFWGFSGRLVDNTDVFVVMCRAVNATCDSVH